MKERQKLTGDEKLANILTQNVKPILMWFFIWLELFCTIKMLLRLNRHDIRILIFHRVIDISEDWKHWMTHRSFTGVVSNHRIPSNSQ